MRKGRRVLRGGLGILSLLGILSCTSATLAQEKSVAEEILDILRANGQISEEQHHALLEKARTEEAKRQSSAELQQTVISLQEKVRDTPSRAGNQITAYWKEGLRLDSYDGNFKLRIGGRIQNDWALFSTDKKVRRDVNNGLSIGDGTELRRARLYVQGEIYKNIKYKAEYDFAGGDADFNDVFIELTKMPHVGSLRIGHFKEPFSLELLTSSKYFTFMERATPIEAFAPGRNTGFMLSNAFFDKRMTLAAGVFRDSGDSGNGFGPDSNYNVTARWTGLPLYQNGGERLIHIGFGYSHKFLDGRETRFRSRPEAHLAPRFVDTGLITADSVDLFDPEIAVVYGPLSAQFEWSGALVDRPDASDLFFSGYYIQGGYFLTGEHRVYNTSAGSFARVKPKSNFDWHGGWGAWEVAARWSGLDLDDTPQVRGGKLGSLTLGLNWYLNPNVRWMANYVFANLGRSGEAGIAETRFMIDF